MDTEYFVVETTTETIEEAENLAESMVKNRLAGCAHVQGPITSFYWWEGELTRSKEWKCSLKTNKNKYRRLEDEIRNAHSYETPEIVAIPLIRGSESYFNWLDQELE